MRAALFTEGCSLERKHMFKDHVKVQDRDGNSIDCVEYPPEPTLVEKLIKAAQIGLAFLAVFGGGVLLGRATKPEKRIRYW